MKLKSFMFTSLTYSAFFDLLMTRAAKCCMMCYFVVKALILLNIAPVICEDIGYISVNIHLNMQLVGLTSVIWFFKKWEVKNWSHVSQFHQYKYKILQFRCTRSLLCRKTQEIDSRDNRECQYKHVIAPS